VKKIDLNKMFVNSIKMYNKYTYDLSKDKPNMNLDIADFFEEIEPIDINKILDEINANLIKSIQEPEEPAPKKYSRPSRPSRPSTYRKYKI